MEIISEQVPHNISVLSKGTKEYACRINFSEGSFSFRTIDFTIIQRTKEIESTIANLSENEREGISLSMDGTKYRVNL